MSRHGARHGRPSRGENHEREAARQERPGHHRQHRHRARRGCSEPLKTLKQQGATVTHATIEGGEAQTWVHDSEKDLIVNSDARLQGLRAEDYDLLLVPGGTVNADTLRQDSEARRLVREFSDAGKTVAAICHGPGC